MVGKLHGRFQNRFCITMHGMTSLMKSAVEIRVKKIILKKTLTTKILSMKRRRKGKMMRNWSKMRMKRKKRWRKTRRMRRRKKRKWKH
jgi:hypothetical protein